MFSVTFGDQRAHDPCDPEYDQVYGPQTQEDRDEVILILYIRKDGSYLPGTIRRTGSPRDEKVGRTKRGPEQKQTLQPGRPTGPF